MSKKSSLDLLRDQPSTSSAFTKVSRKRSPAREKLAGYVRHYNATARANERALAR